MRKAVVAGVAALAVAVLAFVLAPTVTGQNRREGDHVRDRHVMTLDDRGGEIGVTIRDLDADEVSKAKLQQAGGVIVQDVEEDGPAAKAGIKAGDVIVEFDNERVRGARHFARLVRETPEGRTVKTTIVRDGARQTLEVTPQGGARFSRGFVLPEMPDIERELERAERGFRRLPRNFSFDFHLDPEVMVWPRGRFGVSLVPLSDQLASYFGVKDGALVSSVEADSPTGKAGLKAGDVVTSIDGHAVNDPGDVIDGLRDAEPGSEVEIGIVRDRKSMTVKATIPERPARRRNARPA